ncbi:CoA ester lyase [Salinirubellus salinus]|uniref:CoA ester lyase n=1 Tax=Salinirubellus salinus TaxID=1364945 RepID=A0A9E7R658_9EURY|nr:CoA ester lyase [Salinirubellus salinus]UWM55390.1 CoA ester lyase [Salinirubellus salinus]
MARRSLLFSPADRPELLRKGPDSGADVVCSDLEDAVAPERKPAAREGLVDLLSDPSFDPDCEVCVRINSDRESAEADLEALLGADADLRLDSLMVPKAESAAAIEALAEAIARWDVDLPLLAICESAAGVLHAEEIAAADPVDCLLFGAEDLSADVGATRTREGTEVLYAREKVVTAAAAAGVDAIDTLVTDFEATDHLREDTRFGLQLGYDGKMCIHPAQVSVVNEAFTPDAERVAWARRVLEANAEAEAEGRGVFQVDGEMIDAPLVAQAERVRERAAAAGVWD